MCTHIIIASCMPVFQQKISTRTGFKVGPGKSQRGSSPFRDGAGWPALLPYIRKICVSVAIGNQSGIRLHERVHMVKIWGFSKTDQNQITAKALKL